MPARFLFFAFACLLVVCAIGPAVARPSQSSGAALRVGVRILADCRDTGARRTACGPAQQRSDSNHTVPAQVATLSPVDESNGPGHAATVTVTY